MSPTRLAALSLGFVLVTVPAFAQPGSGPWIRAAMNLEGTVMTVVAFIAVIAVVGAVFAYMWESHGGQFFGIMVKLALGCATALGAREIIQMFR